MEKTANTPKSIQTRNHLCDVLEKMLMKESFQKISVNDICEEALISRSGFYKHFEDKYQLLKFCIEKEALNSRKHITEETPLRDAILIVLNYFKERKELMYHLFLDYPEKEIIDIISSIFLNKIEEKFAEQSEADSKVAAVFFAGGISLIILRWLEGRLNMSAEELADKCAVLLEK
ncbi:MAG: TetR-like C-terminal domain-containing protein [Erysipelotrichaceae bacterium]|nr:TetR-like C-terminal domain-containing protein [Erysipelotrichaceae bacterium]